MSSCKFIQGAGAPGSIVYTHPPNTATQSLSAIKQTVLQDLQHTAQATLAFKLTQPKREQKVCKDPHLGMIAEASIIKIKIGQESKRERLVIPYLDSCTLTNYNFNCYTN